MAHREINLTRPPFADNTWPVQAPRVWVRERWDDEWEEDESLHPLFVNFISPGGRNHSSARFIRRYGEGARADEQFYRRVLKFTTDRFFIRVTDGSEFVIGPRPFGGFVFDGIVENVGEQIEGADMGRQEFVAFGLESLLFDESINTSPTVQGITPTTDGMSIIETGLTFNEDGLPNRSPSEETFSWLNRNVETWLFYRYPALASYWSTRNIVDFLLKVHVPVDSNDDIAIKFKIRDEDLQRLPDDDQPEIQCNGVETGMLLNRLINRERLLMWWAEPTTGTDEEAMEIRVATMTDTPIGSIPANDNSITIRRDESPTTQLVLSKDTAFQYDFVRVEGARERAVFSAENFRQEPVPLPGQELIIEGWSAAQRDDYLDGGQTSPDWPSDVTDQRKFVDSWRRSTGTQNVWRRFQLDDRWLFRVLENNYNPHTAKFSSRIVFDVDGPEIKPFALVPDPVKTDLLTTFYKYHYDIGTLAHQANAFLEKKANFKLRLRIERDKLKPFGGWIYLEMQGDGEPHQLADTFPDGFVPIDDVDELEPAIDWRKIVFTLGVTLDKRVYGVWPQFGAAATDAVRTLTIRAGDGYRKIWLAPNTALGPDPANLGGLDRVPGDGGYIVDDTNVLRDLAEQAYRWYSQTRNAIVLTTGLPKANDSEDEDAQEHPQREFRLGQFVRDVHQGRNAQFYNNPVNACITSLRLDYSHHYLSEPQHTLSMPKITIRTAWGQFDINQFAKSRSR